MYGSLSYRRNALIDFDFFCGWGVNCMDLVRSKLFVGYFCSVCVIVFLVSWMFLFLCFWRTAASYKCSLEGFFARAVLRMIFVLDVFLLCILKFESVIYNGIVFGYFFVFCVYVCWICSARFFSARCLSCSSCI